MKKVKTTKPTEGQNRVLWVIGVVYLYFLVIAVMNTHWSVGVILCFQMWFSMKQNGNIIKQNNFNGHIVEAVNHIANTVGVDLKIKKTKGKDK